ncbi:MAG: hypothetical protein U0790_26510 [Isosphaeraceae bacterium]
MSRNHRGRKPTLDALDQRLVLSTAVPTPIPPGSDTVAVLQQFTTHYLSRAGGPRYDPAFDLNHNGQIGQVDGKLLLRRLPPVGPPRPLDVRLAIAPEDQARAPLPQNSGGVTHHREPTVVGRTTPGALIFTGTGTIDARLHGPAYVADATGTFRVPLTLTDGINQFDVLAVDSRGHQRFRAYPIYWLDFAAYEAAHPRRD